MPDGGGYQQRSADGGWALTIAVVRRSTLPCSSVRSAERQFEALVDNTEAMPDRAAYDHLYDLADHAIRWLGDTPCPDAAIGSHSKLR